MYSRLPRPSAVIPSIAEHNGTVTAAWKNVFDWMGRINRQVWQGKPLGILAAAPGPRADAGVLQYASMAPRFGGDIKGSVGIGLWSEAFDTEKRVSTKPVDISALGKALATLTA